MTWMSGICLFLISMRTHSKMRNFEKSDLIYVNSPLRHLEFNSTFRYFSSKMKNDFTYDFTLACRGFFFFFFVWLTHQLPCWAYCLYTTTHYQRNRRCTNCSSGLKTNYSSASTIESSHWTWPIMVSHPTDMRGECQHTISLHIFSTVIVAPSSTEAKASSHTALSNFLPAACWRSDLTKNKNWAKYVCLNVKLMGSFVKVSNIRVLPISFLVYT